MKKIMTVAIFIAYTILFYGCKKDTSASNVIKASVHSTCISVINFQTTDVEAIPTGFGYQISGETSADELGINFYGTPVAGAVYDLSTSTPFSITLYWDPGNDGLDEYAASTGSSGVTGQIEIKDIKINSSGFITTADLRFTGVTVKLGANTLCVNDGEFFYTEP